MAERREDRRAKRDRYCLRYRDHVDSVEKVYGIDEIDDADGEQRPLDRKRQKIGKEGEVRRQAENHDQRRQSLSDEPPRHGQRVCVVGESEQTQPERRHQHLQQRDAIGNPRHMQQH